MAQLMQYNLNLNLNLSRNLHSPGNMKLAIIGILVIASLRFSPIQAQIENQNSALTEFEKNSEVIFEKVYLHLDRPYYSSGDDIWIKAYLVDAMTNELSENSNNLNVELISPGSKIIKRLTLRIEKGLGFGDFHLGDSIASGNYLIRAYTNRMRNFGEIFFFEKEIVIENQIDIKSLNKPDFEESKEKVDVQFFPEGGPLIENVYTLLGFKAINSSGYGCDVKGQVFSSSGDTIISFSSTHLGMGSFFFLPKKGLKYFAAGFAGNGIPFRVELPDALETGYSIKVSDINKDYFRVTIKTNQETLDQATVKEMDITGTSHNSLCLTARVKVKAIDNPVNLSKKEFPQGIACLTLVDTTGRRYCERVFYIHPRENYRISIIPDQEVYAPRQKVTLQISVRDTSDIPVSANLSVSVVDGNQIKGFEKKSDINSYLFLESELRGYIEQPSYYFDTIISERYQALDNLLITQGWRNFIWNNLPDTVSKFNYPTEEGITVSGRLRHVWSDKPITGANISMALSENVSSSFKFTLTDSVGKYHFYGLNFTGPQNILVYAADKKGIGKGLILLDSIFSDSAPVNYKQVQRAKTIAKNISNSIDIPNIIQVSDNYEISDYKNEAGRKYNIMKKYHITDTIGLEEVVINARRPEKENADGHFRPYGEPDISLPITDLMYSNKTVLDVLTGRIPGFFQGRFVRFGPQSTNQPMFMLDGLEVDEKRIHDLQVSDVDKVETITESGKLAFFGFRASYGIVSVFTKRGRNSPIQPPLNFINQPVYGYYQARTFYSPKYDVPQSEFSKPDLRTTIFWEPNLETDIDGNATVSFFNADNREIIKADVEGLAEPGVPVVGKTSFEVK
jgi:hypothetical protein